VERLVVVVPSAAAVDQIPAAARVAAACLAPFLVVPSPAEVPEASAAAEVKTLQAEIAHEAAVPRQDPNPEQAQAAAQAWPVGQPWAAAQRHLGRRRTSLE